MSLIDVRKNFIIHGCGRYDLVKDPDNEDWSDKGADYFIRQGQKWLDRLTTLRHSYARYFTELSVGAWYILIPDCRSIQEVWVSNSEKGKWQLVETDLGELKQNFSNDPADIGSGDPLYYSPIVLRSVPQATGVTTVDQFGAVSYTVKSDNWDFDGIVFLPPVAAGTVLEVHGLFHQPSLHSDGDKNMWTEKNEFILMLAACRMLEVTNRNQAGVADYESAIKAELQGLEFDLVDQVVHNTRQMTG